MRQPSLSKPFGAQTALQNSQSKLGYPLLEYNGDTLIDGRLSSEYWKIDRMNWYVYIVECSDGTLYTGITNNLGRRIREHNSGIGSKYTRGRRPIKLLARWDCADKSHASKMERRIKGLCREDKLRLIINGKV